MFICVMPMQVFLRHILIMVHFNTDHSFILYNILHSSMYKLFSFAGFQLIINSGHFGLQHFTLNSLTHNKVLENDYKPEPKPVARNPTL